MFGFSGCSSPKYNVDYSGQMNWYTNAKPFYRAGAKVRLCYDEKFIATDTDYSFLLDGEKISASYEEGKGFVIEFIMPEHDVVLEANSESSMLPSVPEAQPEFEENPTLTFHSFDGGGPEYSLIIDDPSLVEVTSEQDYGNENHEEIDGAAYNVIFTFTGVKAGMTAMRVEARSPIGDNYDSFYEITVNDELQTSIVQTEITE